MAITNHERVGKAMELLKQGLGPYVDREFRSVFGSRSANELTRFLGEDRINAKRPVAEWDVAALLKLMWESWRDVFGKTLGRFDRSLVQELRDWRNDWAHQKLFSGEDTDRALDSISRLLTSVSAPQATEVDRIKHELRRLITDEQVRTEKRKAAGTAIESAASSGLKPWRDVVTPHKDVASGKYQQAEFAADLWQVYMDEGAAEEYRNPVEFFRRTFLTDSLKRLLVGAVERVTGAGGDPVVQLQTNFGGGKTHSMLALYHLFAGKRPGELPGVESILKDANVTSLPAVKRVVLVGNKISPGNPVTKDDGTVVRTLWGELAWQLGGKKAFSRVAADDEKATSPGDALRELFNEYGPCLILIDEWVAYARQLHDQNDLPGGTFETQFTFAQALTESAKAAKKCLLVISLPASDTQGSPHAQADDVEVGGQRGREALDRLRNVVGRLESSWRPASAEEGFEIVRRRLFEPLAGPDQFRDRDTVARGFADFYRAHKQEFPLDCSKPDYEKRLKDAYPIHPEVFDRLYEDWSTLVKFQRTRGVLRLMAAVIHSLWAKEDRNPLILPANVSIDDPRVQFELTRYLSDNWVPVIEKDVDGPNSLPLRLDGELASSLGRYAACRRVARTIYMGSAPTTAAAHRGLEDRQIKLGCLMPGEPPPTFGDALRRLAAAATYLYQDGPRYWYSTQPTVSKLAEDRAELLKRDPDKVNDEIQRRAKKDLLARGDFMRIHPMPASGQDVPDDLDARLVVLSVDHAYTKDPGNPAEVAARAIWESRGSSPRLFRNSLVFLAPDKTRLQDLDDAARRYLAWRGILDEAKELNLDNQQLTQATNRLEAADQTVDARIPETYQWLLVPVQGSADKPIEWQATRLQGSDALAKRASAKLIKEELLYPSLAGSRLKMELDRVPLWRGDSVPVRQLVEDFGRYVYLPRLKDSSVLFEAIRDGVGRLTWETDTFAIADSYDETAGRYRGLRGGEQVAVGAGSSELLVKSDVAARQIDAETKPKYPEGPAKPSGQANGKHGETEAEQPKPRVYRRFHGSVHLDPNRLGRDAGRIAEEIVQHLSTLQGADMTLSLELQATLPKGVSDATVRTVSENCRTLKFDDFGFEEE